MFKLSLLFLLDVDGLGGWEYALLLHAGAFEDFDGFKELELVLVELFVDDDEDLVDELDLQTDLHVEEVLLNGLDFVVDEVHAALVVEDCLAEERLLVQEVAGDEQLEGVGDVGESVRLQRVVPGFGNAEHETLE